MHRTASALGLFATALLTGSAAPAQDKAAPAGATPLMTLSGSHSRITKEKVVRVTTATEWDALWTEHCPGSSSDRLGVDCRVDLDFDRVMAIAIFGGKGIGNHSYTCDRVTEDKNRIVIRVDDHPYQSGYPAETKRPWGVLVLPRSAKKVVLEMDTRSLIADPPKWTEWTSFPALPRRRTP